MQLVNQLRAKLEDSSSWQLTGVLRYYSRDTADTLFYSSENLRNYFSKYLPYLTARLTLWFSGAELTNHSSVQALFECLKLFGFVLLNSIS